MKYIKKNPHVIEAMQFTGDNFEEIVEFTNGRADYFIHDGAWKLGIAPPQVQMWIKPIGLSIEKPIVEGDYVIKDEASGYGEISVCNQQLFESIYKEYKEDV